MRNLATSLTIIQRYQATSIEKLSELSSMGLNFRLGLIKRPVYHAEHKHHSCFARDDSQYVNQLQPNKYKDK